MAKALKPETAVKTRRAVKITAIQPIEKSENKNNIRKSNNKRNNKRNSNNTIKVNRRKSL